MLVNAMDAQVRRDGVLRPHCCVFVKQVAVEVVFVPLVGQVRRLIVDHDGVHQAAVGDGSDQRVEAGWAGVDVVDREQRSFRVPAGETVVGVHGCSEVMVRVLRYFWVFDSSRGCDSRRYQSWRNWCVVKRVVNEKSC
jgi:hypothetical protein